MAPPTAAARIPISESVTERDRERESQYYLMTALFDSIFKMTGLFIAEITFYYLYHTHDVPIRSILTKNAIPFKHTVFRVRRI